METTTTTTKKATVAVNIFAHAAAVEATFEDWMKTLNGYKRITTFANDFALADVFGEKGVRATYEASVRAYIGNYKYMTELVLVLNFLCNFWHSFGMPNRSKLYGDLYYESRDAFYSAWSKKPGDTDEERAKKEEACQYFFDWTD